MDAIAHIHVETLRLAKQGFVDGRKAAIAVAGSRSARGKTLAGRVKKDYGRDWDGVVAWGWLWAIRAYCGTKPHSQIEAT